MPHSMQCLPLPLLLPFLHDRKVIRLLHPDKHGGLDASASELMELTKLFTVLSESYNSYKLALDQRL